ncbi:MAG TPA: co-chaperone YbbN [Gammaproteobacteria bacterium]|nr:co-chaperone YbbN [Gammaproteobacteria bacterium]
MADSPFVFDTTADTFSRLVLENSDKGPVLVNYWSPRAGPCLMLMPRLVRLADEFGGRFLLVMLNTDDYGQLARTHGVMSLPTVKVFRNGNVVDTLHGAESEETLRRFIDKQLTDTTDGRLRIALTAQARGETENAVRLAAEAALADPHHPRIPLELAKLLVLQERYAQADDLLQALPEESRSDPELHKLATHVAFLRAAREAPSMEALEKAIADHPDNLEARYQLSARHLVASNFEPAMQQLLEIVRRNRDFRRDAGRQGLLALFELLGDDDEQVVRYRALLNETRH